MAELLVSVRSAAEAEAALSGGAALIDVKEPENGSLGRAPEETIAAVIRAVDGRRPVSAALGELKEQPDVYRDTGLKYAKWGLAGLAQGDWRHLLITARDGLQQTPAHCRLVAVAYADWRRAAAPSPTEVCHFAVEHGCGAFLLDTWHKDGSTLLDWLALPEIAKLGRQCRTGGVPLALAGSLGPKQIARLRSVTPQWFAVRGAVCAGGKRYGGIDAAAVRELTEIAAGRIKPAKLASSPA
jgi:uncharacterized protein (UPF0264 family)